MSDENNYRVNSVKRAGDILKCFSLENPELTLVEISKMARIPKPTAFRILSTLEEARLVQKTEDGLHYRVGIMCFELGGVYIGNLSIESIARPVMDELAQTFGMSVNLGMLDDGKVVYLGTADPRELRRYNPIIGYRHFIHCSALGKVLASSHSEDQVMEMLNKHGMPIRSEKTITDPQEYLDQLQQVKVQKFAVDDEESAVGMFCMAVPIRDHEGKIMFAMSISGAKPLFSNESYNNILKSIKQASVRISRQLGWKEKEPLAELNQVMS